MNKKSSTYEGQPSHYYTVIVPFRNEQNNLPNLLSSLQGQSISDQAYEVILVNDHSDDSSVEIINRFIPKAKFSISLLHLETSEGKKQALLKGIKASAGSVIVTTDADCTFGKNWLNSIAEFYENSDTHMVTGPVTIEKESTFFEKLQTIEFASLIGSGAASLALHMPNMCNGANLSFLRTAFFDVGGYNGNEKIASGDDEFLMHKFWKAFEGKVRFNKSKDGIVYTRSHKSWYSFFQQRKRWASKWKHYSSIKTSALAVFILMFNMSFITALGLLVAGFQGSVILVIVITLKVILELFFLNKILNFLNKGLNLIHFIFLQFTYPFYVIIFGIAANFGTYRWKGRKH
ncbi:glycosyltransferase [Fulvivirga ulvae]|uniref:glycosyltransferase n=1 Tax=Fulvivirga ulvae TaxID=2904245 RepID=UPI001F2833DF|nr:glycosyltransferase [Fulvivirga ulvae]UII30200.1 glycosyltransferase [Fulvivirga ulvae]